MVAVASVAAVFPVVPTGEGVTSMPDRAMGNDER